MEAMFRPLVTCNSSLRHVMLFLVLTTVVAEKQDTDIVLERQLQGSGFHREIVTTLTVSQSIRSLHASPHCGLLLFERLPSGMYADPFQVQSLAQFGGPKVVFDRAVDIEAAEFLSKPHELYVFINDFDENAPRDTSHTVTVSLPIHARYHKSSSDAAESHATVTILHPGLYTNCSGIDGGDTITAPCDMSNKSNCLWSHLAYKSSSSVLRLQVPVGQEQHKPLVVVVTLVVSICVCALLVKVIWLSQEESHQKSL